MKRLLFIPLLLIAFIATSQSIDQQRAQTARLIQISNAASADSTHGIQLIDSFGHQLDSMKKLILLEGKILAKTGGGSGGAATSTVLQQMQAYTRLDSVYLESVSIYNKLVSGIPITAASLPLPAGASVDTTVQGTKLLIQKAQNGQKPFYFTSSNNPDKDSLQKANLALNKLLDSVQILNKALNKSLDSLQSINKKMAQLGDSLQVNNKALNQIRDSLQSMNLKAAKALDSIQASNLIKNKFANGQNKMTVQGADVKYSFSATNVTSGTTVVFANVNVSGYKTIRVQLTATASTGVTFQGTNDPANSTSWGAVLGTDLNVASGSQSHQQNTNSTTHQWIIPVNFTNFRLLAAATNSGTDSGYAVLSTLPEPVNSVMVVAGGALNTTSSGTTTVISNAAPSGVPVAASTSQLPSPIYSWNGGNEEPGRIADSFTTILDSNSGNTAVLTPASGKYFRLLGYEIIVPSNVVVPGSGIIEVTFKDGTSGTAASIIGSSYSFSTSTTGGAQTSGYVNMGNGYGSRTVNNVMQVNLSAAPSKGHIRINLKWTSDANNN